MNTPAALLAASLLALAGCAGQGSHTKGHASAAKIKMNGVKAATSFQMAQQAFLAGELTKALKYCDESLALSDSVPRSRVLRGRILMEMGNLEAAGVELAKAEALDPTFVEAQYYQGILAERYLRREDALARYQAAAKLDPSNPQYALAAGEMLIDLSRLDDARAYLTEQATAFQNNAGIRQTLGHIALMQEDADQAVENFKQARLLAPEDKGIQEDLASAYVRQGAFADAERTFASLAASPEYSTRRDIQLMRAQCLVKLDRPVDARTILLDVTRDSEGATDVEAWIALGNVSYMLKDINRVRQASSRIVALTPRRSEGHLLQALYFRQANQFARAEQAAAKAVELKPGVESYTLLALIQQDLGKAQLARANFDLARQAEADNAANIQTAGAREPNID